MPSTSKISIKPVAQIDQLKAIEQLASEIWHQHYTPIIGREQVIYMLDKFQSVPAMQEQLDSGYHYFSASLNGNLVGYLSFRPDSTENHLFLSKIYLHQSTRGMGFGREMVTFVEMEATKRQLPRIQLTVNKYNTSSIAAYEKLGFKIVDEVVADIGKGYVMDDYILEKEVAKA